MPRFTIREINCKSAINRVQNMPFSWSINPYRGCRHACVYCYARPTHEYLGLGAGRDFDEVIFAKVNAPDVVRRELGRRSWNGDNVVIGTATDPYQQAESSYRLTRRILEAFRDYSNQVSITTKSPMILRDTDVLDSIVKSAAVTVCITITTLDELLWRKIEPTTSKPIKRLETVSRLRDLGVNVGVLLCPILPGLTDDIEHLEPVVAAAAQYGAQFLASQVLRLGAGISDSYLPFIETEFPKLMGPYRDLYRGDYAPGVYVESMRKRVEDLKQRYGLRGDRAPQGGRSREASPRPRQLDLFRQVA